MDSEESNIDHKNLEGLPNEITPELIKKYSAALSEFKEPKEDQLISKNGITIRQHPNHEIEDYFEWVTKTGKSAISWDLIKPVFIWKMRTVLNEMMRLEKVKAKDDAKFNVDKDTEFKMKFIFEHATDFEGPPFTFQRICELLVTPSRHYKKFDKFVRALDKNINVVTTVTELGIRITGVEFSLPDEPSNGKVEQHFFGKVDELDGLPPAGASNKEPKQEISSILIGPVLPSSIKQQDDEEPIDMSTKFKEKLTNKSEDSMEVEERQESPDKPKEGDLPIQSATDVREAAEDAPRIEDEEAEIPSKEDETMEQG